MKGLVEDGTTVNCRDCVYSNNCNVASAHKYRVGSCWQFEPKPDPPEPEPVGHWRKANDRPRSWVYICSECGETAYFPNPKHFHSCGYKFCPNCGVKMIQEPK